MIFLCYVVYCSECHLTLSVFVDIYIAVGPIFLHVILFIGLILFLFLSKIVLGQFICV